ncbi:MAG: XdhC family protein [Oscillospiraceae bacterium]|jgi:xanthine dehydrogenase accessory factor|nr:XdhC family protein [Oscillospiraceae bacterium]
MDIYTKAKALIERRTEFTLVTEYALSGITKRIEERTDDRGAFRKGSENDHAAMSEYYAPRPALIIFGGGHIALPVCSLGAMVGFDVTVYDDRPAFANSSRFPDATRVICDSFENIAGNISLTAQDYVVIVTRGHKNDQDCLRFALAGEFPYYCGMIGSRRRVAIVRNQIIEEGYSAERLEKVQSPIGLDIGAVTPEEIAVSIIAQIIEYKRRDDRRGHYHGNFSVEADIVERLAALTEPAALVTVVRTDGSTPREEGARMIVYSDGSSYGTIGGGCAEADVARSSRQVMASESGWSIYEVDLTDDADEDGMVCGGTMRILIERVEAAENQN